MDKAQGSRLFRIILKLDADIIYQLKFKINLPPINLIVQRLRRALVLTLRLVSSKIMRKCHASLFDQQLFGAIAIAIKHHIYKCLKASTFIAP